MKKIVYIIPGRGETPSGSAYKKISRFFRRKKIEPIPVEILWKNRVMTDYVKQFIDKYNMRINKKRGNDEVYLFGFSFGAMISFISSTEINLKLQILCSLSPYFREDLIYVKDWWKGLVGKRRIEDFGNYSFDDLTNGINCENILVYGSEEDDICLKRAMDAEKKLKNSKLIIVKGAKQDISQKEYLGRLEEIILGIS